MFKMYSCKTKPDSRSILNLQQNISAVKESYVREPYTFETQERLMYDIKHLIDSTIHCHLQNGDISSHFEKDFREFIASIISCEIRF